MRTVAVLIDAENVQASFGDKVFSYANSLGNVVVKEIYGVASALGLWVEPVLKYAIHPNLTIKASKFKNTSDISLVIGAMDLLLAGEVDTVIIVSSDSDFSTLSVRLRSAGLEVIGMGTEKVNPLWRTACSSFVILSSQAPQRPVTYVVKPPEPEEVPAPKVQKPEEKAVVVPITKPIAVQTPDKVSRPVSEQEQKTADLKKQGTPVIVLPEPAKPAGNAALAQPKQVRPRAAVTHSDRAAVIRSHITKHLEMNGGKMSITNIFHALNSLPDYHVDQQGSKRKPLNYLMWLFGDVFAFEDGMIMFPELSKGAKLKGEQKADQARKDESEGVKKVLSGAAPTALEAEKSESSDASAATPTTPEKVIPVQTPAETAATEKAAKTEPVKRIGSSSEQNLSVAAEKKAKDRPAETMAPQSAEKAMNSGAKQTPVTEFAAEKAEQRTETAVPERTEKPANPAAEQTSAAEPAEEKTEQPAEAAKTEQAWPAEPAAEQTPAVEPAEEKAEQPAEAAKPEQAWPADPAAEQVTPAEPAIEKAEQPAEAAKPEQAWPAEPTAEEIPAAEPAEEKAEQPAEVVAQEQAEKPAEPAAEESSAAEPAEEKAEQPAEAAKPEQAWPAAEETPAAELAAEKEEPAEAAKSEQARPAAEEAPAAEPAEEKAEQAAEAAKSEQAWPAAEEIPAAEPAEEKAEEPAEAAKPEQARPTEPGAEETPAAESAEAAKPEQAEKPAEAVPENRPAGKTRGTERRKKADASEKPSGNKEGNRSGTSGKKQNEPRGNRETSAEEKTKDEQNKRVTEEAKDQTSQEQQPADGKGNSRKRKASPKKAGKPERSGSQNEPWGENNSEAAADAPNEEKTPGLESIVLGKIGIQLKAVKILTENGYKTLADVAGVSDKDLLQIKGIGQATVDQIRLSVKNATEKE